MIALWRRIPGLAQLALPSRPPATIAASNVALLDCAATELKWVGALQQTCHRNRPEFDTAQAQCRKGFDIPCLHVAIGGLILSEMIQGNDMPKEEWGVKRLCPKCATRFYDLQKDPMTCPACEVEFDLATLMETGNKTVTKVKEKPAKPEAAETVLDDEDIILDDEEDTETSTDDNLLEDDDDDTASLEAIADVPAKDDD